MNRPTYRVPAGHYITLASEPTSQPKAQVACLLRLPWSMAHCLLSRSKRLSQKSNRSKPLKHCRTVVHWPTGAKRTRICDLRLTSQQSWEVFAHQLSPHVSALQKSVHHARINQYNRRLGIASRKKSQRIRYLRHSKVRAARLLGLYVPFRTVPINVRQLYYEDHFKSRLRRIVFKQNRGSSSLLLAIK